MLKIPEIPGWAFNNWRADVIKQFSKPSVLFKLKNCPSTEAIEKYLNGEWDALNPKISS